jgi:hypothetical protein
MSQSPSDILRALLAVLKGEGGISGLGDVRALPVLPDAPFCIVDTGTSALGDGTFTVDVASSAVTSGSPIFVQNTASGYPAPLSVTSVTAGSGFTVIGNTSSPQPFTYLVLG